jgi:hypothetical protein
MDTGRHRKLSSRDIRRDACDAIAAANRLFQIRCAGINAPLVIRAADNHVWSATAFRQMKRTVVLPARFVRAWPKQPDFPL